MRANTLFLALVSIVSSAVIASGEEMYYRNCFQTNPLSVITGSYMLNYEHKFSEKQGLFIEGSVSDSKQVEGYAASLHYRHYKEPKLNGKFLFFTSKVGIGYWGLFVRYTDTEGEIEVEEHDVKTPYPYTFDGYHFGANFGKNCLWDSGFSLSYRIGYGIPITNFKWTEGTPDGGDVTKVFTKVFSGLDVGVSMGWSF
jgi:hypothetical protein